MLVWMIYDNPSLTSPRKKEIKGNIPELIRLISVCSGR